MRWIFGPIMILLLLWWAFTGENVFKNGGTMEVRAKQRRVSISKVSKEKNNRIKDLKTFTVTYRNIDGPLSVTTRKFAYLDVSNDSLRKLEKLGVIVRFDSSTKEIIEQQSAYDKFKTPRRVYKREESPDDPGHEYFQYLGIEMIDNLLVMPEIVTGAKSN